MRTKANDAHIRREYANVQLETIQNAKLHFLLRKKRHVVELHVHHEYQNYQVYQNRVCGGKQGQILNKNIKK